MEGYLNDTLQVDVEELELMTGVLLALLQGINEMEDVKHITQRLNVKASERLNAIRDIKDGKRSIKQYKQFLILEYIKKAGGVEHVNRRAMMEYAGVSKYDILYTYIGDMIEDGLIDFDMHTWSNHAGKFMKDGE